MELKKLIELQGRLWAGWRTLSVVCMLIALWQIGFELFGTLILPEPLAAFNRAIIFLGDNAGYAYTLATLKRAVVGFLLASFAGIALGLCAGWSNTLSLLCRPVITVSLGVPPIAWIVLAMLWFGARDGTPIFTVFIATAPIIFAGTLQGVRMRDVDLDEMAKSYRIGWLTSFWHVQLPQIVAYLFPAWATAFGVSWKVVVMAELLSSSVGIGAGLSEARVNIDSEATMAWIAIIVGLLLLIEGLVLNPIKDKVEGWKHAA
ncbi:ABC transporter permease [Polycladidibacter stylochi]|uniref:ABC transporter permease n=1 Tax=Polycladidibacter stylochi TaxID=1807766 RepID=UPI00082F7F62|nr:ABC transporter permease subunit [Pseudovibrio stylochi]